MRLHLCGFYALLGNCEILRVNFTADKLAPKLQGCDSGSAAAHEWVEHKVTRFGVKPDEQGGESFGLTLGNLTGQMARRLNLPSGTTGAVINDVDQDGPSAGILRPGDVITAVNGNRVSNAGDASRELSKVPAGRNARIMVFRDGNEVFLMVKKQ